MSEAGLHEVGDFAIYLCYRLVSWLLGRLPLIVVFYAGELLGLCGYFIAGPYRRLAESNLKIAYPDWSSREICACAKLHFQRLIGNLLCAVVLAEKPWTELKSRIDFSDFETIRERFDNAKSVIWAANHIGNWELMVFGPKMLEDCGTRTRLNAVIYQPLRNRFIDQHLRRTREKNGLEQIERKQGLVRSPGILKGGGTLAILVDQHAGDKGIWTPFFGRLASTTPFPALLARATGAEILPVAMMTDGPARWRMRFGPFISQRDASTSAVTGRINQALEDSINLNPSDWFWVHQRWKTPSPKFLLRSYKRGIYLSVRTNRPFRILVRSTNWLGDAVMSVPAIRSIKRGRPDAHLTVLAPAKLADFWRNLLEIDEVIAIEESESVWQIAEKIRNRFDVSIIFPNSVRSALESWLAGIPRRVGFRATGRKWMLNQIIREHRTPQPLAHQSQHYLKIAQAIGADIREQLTPPMQHRNEAGVIGICPGAEYGPAKRWPFFAEAAKEIANSGFREVLVFGTAKDQDLGKQITEAIGAQGVDLTGRTSMLDLIRHLGRCSLLLTNDTGTMHLAAFLGVPTISIFGSTEPRLTGPLGDRQIILRKHVECSPCFLRTCPLDFRCMKAVTVAEVLGAVQLACDKAQS